MAIIAIKKNRVSDEVFEQIKQHIISGEWTPGSKIPGELELAKLFGVSRVSIREGIHRLVGMGVLSIKRGEGTFVTELLPKDYFSALLPVLMIDTISLVEMLEFRAMVEVESARIASVRADEQDIKGMTEIMAKMEESQGNEEQYAAEDLHFHTALAFATHNSVIIKVNAIIHDMLGNNIKSNIALTGCEGGLYYHTKIFDAVSRKDAETAAEHMREHINETIRRITEIKGEASDNERI